jgi:hypothetical protein
MINDILMKYRLQSFAWNDRNLFLVKNRNSHLVLFYGFLNDSFGNEPIFCILK